MFARDVGPLERSTPDPDRYKPLNFIVARAGQKILTPLVPIRPLTRIYFMAIVVTAGRMGLGLGMGMGGTRAGDVVERCLAALERARRHSLADGGRFRDQVGRIADEVAGWTIPGEVKVEILLRPIELALFDRHGHDEGARLYYLYLEAFWPRALGLHPR